MRYILKVSAIIWAIVALILVFGCGKNEQTPDPEYRVYNDFLSDSFRDLRKDVINTVIFLEDTYVFDREHLPEWLSSLSVHLPGVEDSTLRSFVSVNKTSARLRDEFDVSIPITLISGKEHEALPSDGAEFREHLEKKYPGSVGVGRLSRVGFNEAGTQALLNVEISSPGICSYGSRTIVLLALEGDEWIVREYTKL